MVGRSDARRGAGSHGRRSRFTTGAWMMAAILLAGSSAAIGQTLVGAPVLDFRFDTPIAGSDNHGATQPTITTQFAQPDFVPGISGRAWRSDGFSSWLSAPLTLSPVGGFTIETWVALESLPSDVEGPVGGLKPAALMQQATAETGFDQLWALGFARVDGRREPSGGSEGRVSDRSVGACGGDARSGRWHGNAVP
jgi:beta-fructofuranosidase